MSHYVREYIAWLESATKTEIAILGTGEKNGENIHCKKLLRDIRRD